MSESKVERRVKPSREETDLPGVIIFHPKAFPDDRGYFAESYRLTDWSMELNFHQIFLQDNLSRSSKGCIRGLHVQSDMGKLVRCVSGEILDVAVDVRPDSPHFGKCYSTRLSDTNLKSLWVPKGFAHGFQALTENAVTFYKCTAIHNPEAEFAINPFDPAIDVPWPITDQVLLSDKVRFAHGFQALTENAVTFYKCTAIHNPEAEFAINPFDPAIDVPWPITDQVLLSDKVRFAHGFQALTENAVTFYKCTAIHNPEAEFAINPFDPAIDVPWPITDQVLLSDKVRFAHGFQALTENAVTFYKCTAIHNPEAEFAINPFDPAIDVPWPITDQVLLSDKVRFAHGFQALTENAVTFYKCTAIHNPEAEFAINPFDPAIDVPWPITDQVLLSDKVRFAHGFQALTENAVTFYKCTAIHNPEAEFAINPFDPAIDVPWPITDQVLLSDKVRFAHGFQALTENAVTFYKCTAIHNPEAEFAINPFDPAIDVPWPITDQVLLSDKVRFAHGFQALTENAVTFYKCTAIHNPEAEFAINPFDPAIDVPWPITDQVLLSDKVRFVHGFQALTENAVTFYKCTAIHNPEAEFAINPFDPAIDVPWPITDQVLLSDKVRFAHGFQALTENAVTFYKCTAIHNPEAEFAINPFDPAIDVPWPITDQVLLSDKVRFAHGFQALTENAVTFYKCTAIHNPEAEFAINPFDPAIDVPWPITDQVLLSDKVRFAHGFQALTENAVTFYKCTAIHNPEAEFAINPFDPAIDVPWPITDQVLLSDKDKNAPNLKDITDIRDRLMVGNEMAPECASSAL